MTLALIKKMFHTLKNFPYELGAWMFVKGKTQVGDFGFPYVCQFASRDLVSSFWVDKSLAVIDPLWEEYGASSREEYVMWSWSLCGMACLSMILSEKGLHPLLGLVSLGKEAMEYGVYHYEGSNKASVSALHYQPFLRYISTVYGLSGKSFAYASTRLLVAYLVRGYSVIVSVDPSLRLAGVDSSPISYSDGGHLVLITGYSLWEGKLQQISLHNPSGCVNNNSQESVSYDADTFSSYWSGRMMVIFRDKQTMKRE